MDALIEKINNIKESVLKFVPIQNQNTQKRIGALNEKALFKLNGNSKISEEEFSSQQN